MPITDSLSALVAPVALAPAAVVPPQPTRPGFTLAFGAATAQAEAPADPSRVSERRTAASHPHAIPEVTRHATLDAPPRGAIPSPILAGPSQLPGMQGEIDPRQVSGPALSTLAATRVMGDAPEPPAPRPVGRAPVEPGIAPDGRETGPAPDRPSFPSVMTRLLTGPQRPETHGRPAHLPGVLATGAAGPINHGGQETPEPPEMADPDSLPTHGLAPAMAASGPSMPTGLPGTSGAASQPPDHATAVVNPAPTKGLAAKDWRAPDRVTPSTSTRSASSPASTGNPESAPGCAVSGQSRTGLPSSVRKRARGRSPPRRVNTSDSPHTTRRRIKSPYHAFGSAPRRAEAARCGTIPRCG